MIPFGLGATFINFTAVRVVIGVGTGLLLASFTFYAVVVTGIFLRPIMETMVMSQKRQVRSQAYSSIQLTKRMTLAGTTLLVVNTALLYVLVIMWCVVQGPFVTNPWLNMWVLFNVSSILNDFSMLLISGVLKQVSISGWVAKFATQKSATKNAKVAIVPSYGPNATSDFEYS